ncbi:hypothetical protein BO83DRAFT_382896 [Aspergillus eucalypticola CBS 122712]|uniref:Uncharacterized protein n=1 Tax=Aspergillus eucalypticola (strain CBS 122712 / IBT 29274) TaxID=1448314 RepID=A0A317UNQ4_ASPEC|nr:uncharacterized protein BO83DRAFT_382896 [Aspergillus eucalypticola CBS 122712]PWY63049.1 hypothetical protein BO83DRAFT_382896 [Aspergillus eucalypticola CBS 122712]
MTLPYWSEATLFSADTTSYRCLVSSRHPYAHKSSLFKQVYMLPIVLQCCVQPQYLIQEDFSIPAVYLRFVLQFQALVTEGGITRLDLAGQMFSIMLWNSFARFSASRFLKTGQGLWKALLTATRPDDETYSAFSKKSFDRSDESSPRTKGS